MFFCVVWLVFVIGGATLVFDVELLAIKPGRRKPKKPDPKRPDPHHHHHPKHDL